MVEFYKSDLDYLIEKIDVNTTAETMFNILVEDIISIKDRLNRLEFDKDPLVLEIVPADLYDIASEFWKNDPGDYESKVGQQTGLLSRFAAYILNNEEKIRNEIASNKKIS
jgi:hypothetical protein